MSTVSIAFVDDHPMFLDGLVMIFRGKSDFEVIGTGKCAADAVALAGLTRPDILIVDLSMPGDIFVAIEKIRKSSPDTKVIAFTAYTEVDLAIRALEAGVSGYVLKGSTDDELCTAIRSVLVGETFITQSFATKVIASLRGASTRNEVMHPIKLSYRDDQIIKLLLHGRTNREIAYQLRISEKTVKHYMTLLMQKLNVRNRVEVIIAVQKMSGQFNKPSNPKPEFVN